MNEKINSLIIEYIQELNFIKEEWETTTPQEQVCLSKQANIFKCMIEDLQSLL